MPDKQIKEKQDFVLLKLTPREAQVIERLRRFTYGEFIIFKSEGQLLRTKTSATDLLTDEVEIKHDKQKIKKEK